MQWETLKIKRQVSQTPPDRKTYNGTLVGKRALMKYREQDRHRSRAGHCQQTLAESI